MTDGDVMTQDSIATLTENFFGRGRNFRIYLENLNERMISLPYQPVESFNKAYQFVEKHKFLLQGEVIKKIIQETEDLKLAQMSIDNIIIAIDSTKKYLVLTADENKKSFAPT